MIKPLAGYILIEEEEPEDKTSSGIYLPETAQQKPAFGKVMAVGESLSLPNGLLLTTSVKLGDKVVYKKWAGDEVKTDEGTYKLIKFDDLMATL